MLLTMMVDALTSSCRLFQLPNCSYPVKEYHGCLEGIRENLKDCSGECFLGGNINKNSAWQKKDAWCLFHLLLWSTLGNSSYLLIQYSDITPLPYLNTQCHVRTIT